MITSVLEWTCQRCEKVHRRQIQTTAGAAIRVATYTDPRIPIGPLESIPSESGEVTFLVSVPMDLSCVGADILKPSWAK